MSKELSPEIKAQIDSEAEHYANVHIGTRAKFIDHHLSTRWDSAKDDWEAGAETYAEKWEQAEQLIDKMAKALEIVQKWQTPSTGKFWNDREKTPMSYEACYGSNGVRDFMKNVANQAMGEYNIYKIATDDTANG